MPELMSFNCPHCNVGLKAPSTAAGRNATCNKCSKQFIVPAQFEMDDAPPSPKRTEAAPSTEHPIFTKPSPKPQPTKSATQQKTEDIVHVIKLASLPAVVFVVLAVGAWWYLSGGGESDDRNSKPQAQSTQDEAEAARSAADKEAEARKAEAAKREAEEAKRKKEEEEKAAILAKKAEEEAIASQSENKAPPIQSTSLVATQKGTSVNTSKTDISSEKTSAPTTPSEPAVVETPKKSSIADLVEINGPSVVVVKTDIGAGAGFVAFDTQSIITNYHVVTGGRSITAIFITGKRSQHIPVTVVAVDPENDLALLRLPNPSSNKVMTFAREDTVRAGMEVFAIGNPGMGSTILTQSVSNGIISSTDRMLGNQRFFQTNTAINPGNSGGPLFDMEGKVVGVVTAKAVQQENIGFVVPCSIVETFYAEREGKFKIEGDFFAWEGKQPLDRLRKLPTVVELNAYPTAMLHDAERNQLIAIIPETNKVVFIDVESKKITQELFAGTDPIDLQFGASGEVWVANRTSKNIVSIDLKTGKTKKTIPVLREPIAFTVRRRAIWYMDPTGQAIMAKMTGKGEIESGLYIRSLASHGSQGDILCGSAKSWLCSFDPDKLEQLLDRQDNLNAAIEKYNADVKAGSPRATVQRRQQIDKEKEAIAKMFETLVKVYNQPAGTNLDFADKQQRLFIDSANKRIYFNRCAMDLKDPTRIHGVFKSPEHSLEGSGDLRKFLDTYPYLRQILAISPDGTTAVSGTHIFNTQDFTVIGELPLPTTSVAFGSDNKTLFLGDFINKTVIGVEYKPKEEPAK